MNAPANFLPIHIRPNRGQVEALEIIAHGCTPRQTAGQLGTSVECVNRLLAGARERLRARNDAHAVALAIAHGLIDAQRIRLVTDAANALGIGAG